MNRRGFLEALAGAIAGAAVDPERLGWVKGAKLWTFGPHPLIEYSPNALIVERIISRSALEALERSLVIGRGFVRVGKDGIYIGGTLNARIPPRYAARVG